MTSGVVERGFGDRALEFMKVLAPHPRSITGEGLRATLRDIDRIVPLHVTEVPSGTRVLDWEVPKEWRLREAWVRGPDGAVVADAGRSPLELVNYSRPFRGRLSRDELQAFLHSDPARPEWTPYRTSYYAEQWGFCLPHARRVALPPGDYEVLVNTELFDGSLTFGEAVVPGATSAEFLVFTHACHPGLVNDNLTGLAVAALVAARLAALPVDSPERQLTYRFVFAPGTIGAIAWLACRRALLPRVRHGLVIGLLGDRAALTFKRSRRGDREIDAIGAHVMAACGGRAIPFAPYGYDERQLCSPGFDLPVGRLTRSANDEYAEYHTSADDFTVVTADRLEESARAVAAILRIAATNGRYRNLKPEGEPRLGRYGLYGSVGGTTPATNVHALLWLLSLSDGSASLLDVCLRSGLDYDALLAGAQALESAGLLARTPDVELEAEATTSWCSTSLASGGPSPTRIEGTA